MTIDAKKLISEAVTNSPGFVSLRHRPWPQFRHGDELGNLTGRTETVGFVQAMGFKRTRGSLNGRRIANVV